MILIYWIYCLFAHPTSSKDVRVAKTMAMYRNPPMGSHDPIIGELKNKHAMRHDGETVKPHQRWYPLVNCRKITIFNGKTHYKWSIFNSYVSHYQRVRATQRTLNKPWLVISSHHCITFHSPASPPIKTRQWFDISAFVYSPTMRQHQYKVVHPPVINGL